MTNSHKMVSCRIISILLIIFMFSITIPVAFAAQTSLSSTNITQFPTVNGTIYYGQTVGNSLTLSGGEVQYNGIVIPGEFVHTDPNFMPTGGGTVAMRASFTFNPADSTNYSSFSVRYSRDVTYLIQPTTPTLADENDKPVVEIEVEPGTKLSDITISGGKIQNPYYPEESRFISKTGWTWVNPDTIVDKSGYYDAIIKGDNKNYTDITYSVYVEVKGSVLVPTIDKPEIVLSYDGISVYSDINFDEAKAYITNEDNSITEIAGKFSVSDYYKDIVIQLGEYDIDAIFTPNDTTAYASVDFKQALTVNKGTVKFVDESGEEIVPEITLPYGFKVGDDLNGYLKEYLNVSASFNYTETEGYGELIVPGTHEYEVKTSSSDKNFEGTTLKFKVTVNQAELELKVKDVVGGKQIYIEGGDTYHLNGNFDVKYFIDGKEAGTIEGVKFNETFEVKQDKSGVYTYEIVYNEAENDPYKVTKVTAAADDIKLQHSVKINGNEPVVYTYGEKVTVTAPAHEKPYYVFTGWGNSAFAPAEDDGEVVDTITFSMPDEDVELEATYEFSIKAFFEYIFSLIVDFFAKIAEFLQLQKVCDFFAGIFAV